MKNPNYFRASNTLFHFFALTLEALCIPFLNQQNATESYIVPYLQFS